MERAYYLWLTTFISAFKNSTNLLLTCFKIRDEMTHIHVSRGIINSSLTHSSLIFLLQKAGQDAGMSSQKFVESFLANDAIDFFPKFAWFIKIDM